MKKTTSSRKQREEREILSYKIRLALSKFTAIIMGEPDNYKSKDGAINYYPSDCLSDWSWSMIDEDGQKANGTTNHHGEVAGIICKGRRHWNDEPQEIAVMFKNI